MRILPVVFEEREIRRLYDEKTDTWFFSVVDIIRVLVQQPDYQAARNYWKVLKNRLRKEGSESVTNCNRLKLPAADGKSYLTDIASAETLLRLVQSVPSPKAEPIKLWLAKVGYERMQEMADPANDPVRLPSAAPFSSPGLPLLFSGPVAFFPSPIARGARRECLSYGRLVASP